MKRWDRPCENCIVRPMCNEPCHKMVTYANIFLYELSINPVKAIWRHKYIFYNQKLLRDWWRIVDMLNTGYLVTLKKPHWADRRHSMEFEIRQVWERKDERESSEDVQEIEKEDWWV